MQRVDKSHTTGVHKRFGMMTVCVTTAVHSTLCIVKRVAHWAGVGYALQPIWFISHSARQWMIQRVWQKSQPVLGCDSPMASAALARLCYWLPKPQHHVGPEALKACGRIPGMLVLRTVPHLAEAQVCDDCRGPGLHPSVAQSTGLASLSH